MYSAIDDDPTKPIALTRSSFSNVSTASLSPFTTLKMPGGNPASRNNSAMRIGTEGSRSEGLRIKALPHAIAGAHFHNGIMAGEIKGGRARKSARGRRRG